MTAYSVADQNNCYHMYTTQTDNCSCCIYIYNKCVSAWQQLQCRYERFDSHMGLTALCVCANSKDMHERRECKELWGNEL